MIQILPSYFSFDEKKLEEFISEMGIISEVQRKIFVMLIHTKSAYIDYQDFFTRHETTSGIRNFEAELLALMRRIKSRFCGMILTQPGEEGTKKNYAIVLLEEGNPLFYYYLLLDLYDNFYVEPSVSFITINALKRKGVNLPSTILKPMSGEEISDQVFQNHLQDKVIYVFSLLGESVPVPSLRLKTFINFCISRLKYTFELANVKDWLSRMLSINIRNVGAMLQDNSLPSLMNLSEVVLANHNEFMVVAKIGERDDFFRALEVFQTYFKNQESEKKDKEDKEQLFLVHIQEISHKLSEQNKWITAEALSKLLESNSKEFDSPNEFKTKALNYLKGSGDKLKQEVPVLFEFKGMYLHKDVVFPFFQKEFLASKPKVKDHLVLLARNALDQSISTIFSSPLNVDKEIADDLLQKDPFVYTMLSQPKLLTEYAFHYMRDIQGIKNMDSIKNQVLLYAPARDPANVPLLEIYDFSVEEIFESAYKSFPFFKKFIFYITGRYKSYQEKAASLDSVRLGAKILSMEHKAEVTEEAKAPSKVIKSRRGGQSRPAPEKKDYTKNEQDKAWKDFGKQLKD